MIRSSTGSAIHFSETRSAAAMPRIAGVALNAGSRLGYLAVAGPAAVTIEQPERLGPTNTRQGATLGQKDVRNFEQPIAELATRSTSCVGADESAVDISDASTLSKKSQQLTKDIYSDLSPWRSPRSHAIRNGLHPGYVNEIFTDFIESWHRHLQTTCHRKAGCSFNGKRHGCWTPEGRDTAIGAAHFA